MLRILLMLFFVFVFSDVSGKDDISENLIKMQPFPLKVNGSVLQIGDKKGILEYAGSYILTFDKYGFGGISGLGWHDGKLYALSDRGRVFVISPEWDNDGISGLRYEEDFMLADERGRELKSPYTDSEALAFCTDGSVAISFERKHKIRRYKTLKSGENSYKSISFGDNITSNLKYNDGVEAMVEMGDSTYLIISENIIDNDKDALMGWQLDESGKSFRIYMKVANGYSVTELAKLSDSNILVLERNFNPASLSSNIIISSFDSQKIKEEAIIAPIEIVKFDEASGIDNMEAATTVTSPQGEKYLIIMSDDNFKFFQKNLMLIYKVTSAQDLPHQ